MEKRPCRGERDVRAAREGLKGLKLRTSDYRDHLPPLGPKTQIKALIQ